MLIKSGSISRSALGGDSLRSTEQTRPPGRAAPARIDGDAHDAPRGDDHRLHAMSRSSGAQDVME